jgi:N-acetyl-anhydromuramyl-L-alanine amidase AmpD
MMLLRVMSVFSSSVLMFSCAPTPLTGLREAPPAPAEIQETVPPDFADAVADTQVPSELLFAVARAETQLQMIVGASEFEGQDPAYGVMGLRGYHLELAAGLAGLDVELVKYDRDANLAAAAALLGAIAADLDIDEADLDAWAPVVAAYSGIADDEATREYVHHEVYGALRRGISVEGYTLPPMEVSPDYPLPSIDQDRGRDGSAVWTPSPNYNSRGGAAVDFVIIHTCESSYSGCWSWLTNSSSGVSAHYVVNDSGSEVRALVDENNRAWHISATYDCANNDSIECWRNGTSMNTISVGIEHAGFASQSSWSSGQLQRSAELTCGITQRTGVVRDLYHIVGHGQLQPWNRTDPGANWPWADYLNRVQVACGDVDGEVEDEDEDDGGGGTSGTPIVIDSNNAANSDDQYVEVSSAWWSSASSAGYWNTGYWVGPTAAISDPASFWFFESDATCYQVEAWWTSGNNRPTAVTFVGWDDEGREVGRSTVSQRTNGSRWNVLGTWQFTPGWNRVLLSRWTTPGSYAIADAVRLTPSTCN